MEFICERCGFKTAYKCSLIQHLKRKTPCLERLNCISREECLSTLTKKDAATTFECTHCSKQFNDNSNRFKHQNICKHKHEESSSLVKKVEELENKLKQILSSTIQNISINNGIVNNQNVNIIVNNFGNENKAYLSKEFLTKCLKKRSQGMLDLIKAIHFNPEHLENNNVRVTNKKDPIIQKLIDARWQYGNKSEVIDELIDEGFEILDEYHYDNEDELKSIMSKRFYDDIDEWLSNIRDKEKETIKPLRRDMYLIVLNNSYMLLTK